MGLFPQRHAWVWAVLPVGVARVVVAGDQALGEALQTGGFELAQRAEADDATLVVLDSSSRLRDAVDSALKDARGGAVAAVIDRAPARGRAGAARGAVARLKSTLAAPLAMIERRRVGGHIARPGTRSQSLPMSDRTRSTYQLGGPLWRRGLAPVGAIVSTIPDGRQTFVEAAIAEASAAVSGPLTVREMTIVESGKMLAELEGGDGERWFLRIAGGPSAAYISNSLHALATIAAADPPAAIRDRLIEPVADGRVGPARYSLERKVAGSHPPKLTSTLWEECMEFLVQLHRLGSDQDGWGEAPPVWQRLETDLGLLDQVLGGAESKAFARLATRLAAGLEGLRLGWEHGDFWVQNMLADNGRLRAVLDWDTAAPASLPLLDLYDLSTVAASPRRHIHVGVRLERVLLPMIRKGGDERVRAYCDATGIPADPGLLEDLGAAYWASRTAREIRERPVRGTLRYWVEENVQRPLEVLSKP